MSEHPKLPVPVRAAIERTQDQMRRELQQKFTLLFSPPFPQVEINITGIVAPRKRPGTLLLELQQYAVEMFDTEARHYVVHARNDAEIQLWLNFLITKTMADVQNDFSSYVRAHNFHCSEAERKQAIMDALGDSAEVFANALKSNNRSKKTVIDASTPRVAGEISTSEIKRKRRLSNTITSHEAVRKLEAFLRTSPLTKAQFATRAETTERTLRSSSRWQQRSKALRFGAPTGRT
jgi:hypothetical protein